MQPQSVPCQRIVKRYADDKPQQQQGGIDFTPKTGVSLPFLEHRPCREKCQDFVLLFEAKADRLVTQYLCHRLSYTFALPKAGLMNDKVIVLTLS